MATISQWDLLDLYVCDDEQCVCLVGDSPNVIFEKAKLCFAAWLVKDLHEKLLELP